jgi:ATP-dependent exoDNAse (exonuclease V) beta subunit
MRRLPTGFSNPAGICAGISQSTMSVHGDGLYAREAGGVASRVFGLGVHTLLESIAMLRKSRTWDEVRQMLQEEKSPLLAKMRAGGLTPVEAKRLAEGAMDVAEHVTYDALGQWILDPHVEGDHEVRWVAVLGGAVRTVQTDRVFRASAKPLEEGDDTWWVVDYKTANLGDDPESALPALRTQFAPQLETYGRVLRKLHGSGTKIRAGIYYPRWQRFDHWELCEDTIVN